jgi:hypothetical protein
MRVIVRHFLGPVSSFYVLFDIQDAFLYINYLLEKKDLSINPAPVQKMRDDKIPSKELTAHSIEFYCPILQKAFNFLMPS